MSLATPTTQELNDTIVAQLEASIGQSIPLLPKAFIRVLAKVLAGAVMILYKHIAFGWSQQFVQYASWKETEVNGKLIRPLVEWGRMLGVGDPLDAVRAELTVQISVLTLGGTLAPGQQLVNPTTEVIYLSYQAVALDAATKDLKVRAYSDQAGNGGAGVIGNLEPGDKLEFARTLGNVAREVTVVSLDTTGADGETESSYRARVLRRKQRPPQGGAYADYRIWGESVAGVQNIYVYKSNIPGKVEVYVECVSSIEPDGIPGPTLLAQVDDAINLNIGGKATRRPTNDLVKSHPIERHEFAVKIYGLEPVEIATTQATALTQALDEHLRTIEPFIVGLSVLPRRDRVTQGEVASIVYQIVGAVGGTVRSVELYNGVQLITAYTMSDGERAKLAPGGITYLD